MKSLFLKDKNRRYMYFFLEKKKYILKYIFNNMKLNLEIRNYAYEELLKISSNSTITKIRNRCVLSNRSRAVYRNFKMSRLFFKKHALTGSLVGVRKASW